MATWVTLGSVDLTDHSSHNYGPIYLQYDSSSTSSDVPCQLCYDNTWGTSLNVTLRNIMVLSASVGNKDVGLQDVTLWSGTLPGGSTGTFSWYCNWYSGGYKPYESGNITIPNPTPQPTPIPVIPPPLLYVSVDGRARRTKKLYCSVGGVAKKVKRLYYGDDSDHAKLIYKDNS